MRWSLKMDTTHHHEHKEYLLWIFTIYYENYHMLKYTPIDATVCMQHEIVHPACICYIRYNDAQGIWCAILLVWSTTENGCDKTKLPTAYLFHPNAGIWLV